MIVFPLLWRVNNLELMSQKAMEREASLLPTLLQSFKSVCMQKAVSSLKSLKDTRHFTWSWQSSHHCSS